MLTISSSSVIPHININRAKRATHTSGLTAAAPRSTNHGRWGTSMGALIFIIFFALCRQGGRTVPVRSVVPRVVPFYSLVLVCGPIPLPSPQLALSLLSCSLLLLLLLLQLVVLSYGFSFATALLSFLCCVWFLDHAGRTPSLVKTPRTSGYLTSRKLYFQSNDKLFI